MRGTMLTAFLMVILLAGPAMANGYSSQFKAFDFGLKGGVNLADLEFDPDEEVDWESFLRFGGGATLGFNITPTFGLDLDVLYMMKGAKFEGDFLIGDVPGYGDVSCGGEARIELDYLVVKPMLRFTPIQGGASPYLLLGGEIGYLLDAKQVFEATCDLDPPVEIDEEEDFTDVVKDLDFGLNVGAGLEFPVGNMSMIIEGHYSLGLANIYDADEDEEATEDEEDLSVKTRGIYGFVGLRF